MTDPVAIATTGVVLGAGLLMLGCGMSSSSSTATGDAGGAEGGTQVTPTGHGTVSGSADSSSFSTVASSLWLGSPDDSATVVVYVFSNPVTCDDLGATGWDARIADRTQVVEMKMFGSGPGPYQVVTTPTPGPGEAAVNYTLSSTSGTPAETSAKSGAVTLTDLQANVHAVGSFDLTFGANRLTGTFDAAYCPGGREP